MGRYHWHSAQSLGLPCLCPFLLFFLFLSQFFWVSFCISFSLCVYLISLSAFLFPPCIVSLHLSLCICLHFSAAPPQASPHSVSLTLHVSVSPALSLSLSTRPDRGGSTGQVQPGLFARCRQGRPGFVAAPPLSGAAAAPYLLASGHETRIRAAWAKDERRQGQADGWREPGCWDVCGACEPQGLGLPYA